MLIALVLVFAFVAVGFGSNLSHRLPERTFFTCTSTHVATTAIQPSPQAADIAATATIRSEDYLLRLPGIRRTIETAADA